MKNYENNFSIVLLNLMWHNRDCN